MNDSILFEDQLIDAPLYEDQLDAFTNDPTIVYPVEFLQNDFCTSLPTMSITDFSACSNYINLELSTSYFSVFLGLIIGFILAKAVADSWT